MNSKKRLIGKILKISPHKVRFAEGAAEEINKAITRSDMRGLIAVNKISTSNESEHSRAHARKIKNQRKKGRRKGKGSQKGKKFSRVSGKDSWMNKVRGQREFLKELKDKKLVSIANFHLLYQKVKGGFFRNKRHIKLYLNEYNLIENKASLSKKEK